MKILVFLSSVIALFFFAGSFGATPTYADCPDCGGGCANIGCGRRDCTGVNNCTTCTCDDGGCFLKGTAVQLLEGDKNIEDIAPGDEIISFDPNTKEITQSTVEAPYSLTRDHYYEIVTSDGKVIKATDEHPFYVGSDLETAPISVKAVLTRGKIYFQDGLEMLSSVFVRDL